MDWMNGGLRPSFAASRPENSLSFLYNCNYSYDHYPGLEMKYPMAGTATPHAAAMMEKNIMSYAGMNEAEKKKRLTNEQLESLENSFMEDQKLEPERKMKLARELELQPRQIAVWFQNRRARWKAKELERSYDALKQDYDAVFTEKKRLQEEVVALKIMLRERASKNHQVSNGYTEISGEETVESTSMENPSSTKRPLGETSCHHHHQMVDQPNYVLNVDEYNPVTPMPAYWSSVMPSYH